ncbi:MAG: hypothetical protein IJP94_08750, partial [Clostridia bacterium]|nr:hypothetical protein [Clostridia bacterium]
MQQRSEEAERRNQEPQQQSYYSEEDWGDLTEPVPEGYDWTKDMENWSEPKERPKTQAELDAEADETTRTLMEEKGVDSPDQLAEETVSRADTKQRNRKFYLSKEGIQTLGSRLYTDVVDDMHPFWNYNKSFEQMQTRLNEENGKKEKVRTMGKQNPYKMAMNAKDASSRSAYLVTDYLTDFDGNVLGKGLIDTLAEGGISKEDYKAFNEYLVANHALEWLDEKSGGKYKKVYEDDRLNNWRVVKKMVDAFESKHPNFKQAAENIYDWQRKLLKAWLVDTGVITQDQYNYFTETYPHYVPFYRETDVAAAGGNTGLANLTDPIKKAQGGNKRILSPIENIMYNTASYVNHASKHAVTKAAVDMYDILESDPKNNVLRAYWEEVFPKNPQDFTPTTFVKKGQTEGEILDATQEAPETSISDTLRSQVGIKDGIVRINDNGTMRYFQVYDKDFLNVLDNVRKGREGLLAAAAAVSRARAALLTSFKPQFALVTNPIRDFGTYLVNSSDVNKAKAIGAAASSYVDIIKKSEAYRQYKAMGGEYSSFTTEGKNELKKALQKLSNEDPNIAKKFFKGVTGVFGA